MSKHFSGDILGHFTDLFWLLTLAKILILEHRSLKFSPTPSLKKECDLNEDSVFTEEIERSSADQAGPAGL